MRARATRTHSLGALPLVNRLFAIELVLLGLTEAVQNARRLFVDEILDRIRDRVAVVAGKAFEIALRRYPDKNGQAFAASPGP